MATFTYLAFDKAKNRKVTGEIESASQGKVRTDLQEKGLYVLRVEEKASGGKRASRMPSFFKSVSYNDQLTFMKSLMLSVRAGVSLAQVFEVLAEQFKNPYFREVLGEVHAGIMKGRSLSECFRAYPKIFPDQFVSMVEAGEQSGKLAEVLEDYVKFAEEAKKLKGEIIGACAYPAVILFAATIAILILVLYIFPTFIKSLGMPMSRMPWLTQMVNLLALTIIEHWVVIFGGGFVLLQINLYFFFKVRVGIRMKDWTQLNFPVLSGLFIKMNLSQFARTMALQSRSGVASVQSLQLTERAIRNTYYKEFVSDIIDTIKRGGTYIEAMKRHPKLMTPLVMLLISVGEQTGTFDEVLDTIAEYYNEEVRVALLGMTKMIEPLMILLMGGVVGCIAGSMFLPLFDLVNQMK